MAKDKALEIDADYFSNLWTNVSAADPAWLNPPDKALTHLYLGNGYYPSWCADVVGKILRKARDDSRYAYGEMISDILSFASINFGRKPFFK